jgi:hypothetical protein
VKRAKDRPIKPESANLEALIADFAREIQVLGAPEPYQDRNGHSSTSDASLKEGKESDSIVPPEESRAQTGSGPQPPVIHPPKGMSVGDRVSPSSTPRKDPQRTQTSPIPKPAVTHPAEDMSVGDRVSPSSTPRKDPQRTQTSPIPKPAVTHPAEEISTDAGRTPSPTVPKTTDRNRQRSGRRSPIRFRKAQDGSWVIVLGRATGRSAWRRIRISLLAAFAITAALALGWAVATGFTGLA